MNARVVALGLILVLASPIVAQFKPMTLDLDGDERPETVHVVFGRLAGTSGFDQLVLTVGQTGLPLQGDLFNGKIVPLDIDRSDRWVELLVPQISPTGIHTTTVVGYRNRRLVDMGKVAGTPTGVGRFDLVGRGDGRLQSRVLGGILHEWDHAVTYELIDGEMVELLLPAYSMDLHPVTMLMALPLRVSPTDSSVAGSLEPEDSALLVASDDVRWVKIERADRQLKGWFEVVAFDSIPAVGLHAPEVFDGLVKPDPRRAVVR